MREVKMILDILPDWKLRSGHDMHTATHAVCELFGGCSYYIGGGCWFPPGEARELVHDQNITWICTIHEGQWDSFKALALRLANGQETVWLVDPIGDGKAWPVPNGEIPRFTDTVGQSHRMSMAHTAPPFHYHEE